MALSGKPTTMLTFWFGLLPINRLTLQYATSGPAAATTTLVADLTKGLPLIPLAGLVARVAHVGKLAADAGRASPSAITARVIAPKDLLKRRSIRRIDMDSLIFARRATTMLCCVAVQPGSNFGGG